jgi:hypothetical protein
MARATLLLMIRHHFLVTTVLLASTGLSQSAADSSASKVTSAAKSDGLPKLAAPFVVHAGGEPIATKTGHAAPFVTDLDGDGIWDLAVGEFGGGGCRLYKNLGTNKEPKFDTFTMSAPKPRRRKAKGFAGSRCDPPPGLHALVASLGDDDRAARLPVMPLAGHTLAGHTFGWRPATKSSA